MEFKWNGRYIEQERLILDTTEQICAILNDQNISRKELAKRLGKSKSYISRILDGEKNITLRTLSDILSVLGYRGHFSVRKQK